MTTLRIPLGCLPRKSDCDLQEAKGDQLPQRGDDVVYIPEGHRLLLKKHGSNAAQPGEDISADEVRAQGLPLSLLWKHRRSFAAV